MSFLASDVVLTCQLGELKAWKERCKQLAEDLNYKQLYQQLKQQMNEEEDEEEPNENEHLNNNENNSNDNSSNSDEEQPDPPQFEQRDSGVHSHTPRHTPHLLSRLKVLKPATFNHQKQEQQPPSL
jgi:hypothetical protein